MEGRRGWWKDGGGGERTEGAMERRRSNGGIIPQTPTLTGFSTLSITW